MPKQGIILFFPSIPSSHLTTTLLPTAKAAGAISSATLYKAANASYDKQHLIAYRLHDVSKTDKFNGMLKESVDGGGEVEWEQRVFGFVQRVEKEEWDADESFPTLLLALMQPSPNGAADLDAWYREEHNQQMSEQPGWKRTTRYSLISQQSNSGQVGSELTFLAMHEFDEGHELGDEVQALQPMSEWTKRVMGEAVGIDAAIYHRVEGF